VAYQGGSPV
jgi:hypothetical protein